MEHTYNFINNFIQKMRQSRCFTEENIITMVCIGFAGYCDIPIKNRYELEYLKYKIEDKFESNKIANAYRLLSEYSSKHKIIVDFIENIPDDIKAEDWKTIVECLISEIVTLPNLNVAETPEILNKLCIKLLNPLSGTFYDGVAGIGSTIFEAKKFSDNPEIYAQEINPLIHALLVLRAYLYEIDYENICCGNTLSEPKFTTNYGKLKTFDYSVMFPPFGEKIKNFEEEIRKDFFDRFHPHLPPSATAEWLFIQHQIASLNENGKGIAVVPSGSLYNTASEYAREKLIFDGLIECIISLPPNMLTYTTVPLNLMVINKNKKADSSILFIRAEELFHQYKTDYKKASEKIVTEITNIYKSKKEKIGISRLINYSELENFILLPSRYVIKPIETKEFGNLFVTEPKGENWTTLKNTGGFYRGINITASSKSDKLSEYKIINYTDVQNGELQEIKDTFKIKTSSYDKNTVLEGDLLISCKGTTIKICVVPKLKEQLLLSVNFIGIHIDSEKYDPNFIKYYLESPAGQSFLLKRQVGTSIFMLSAKDIEEIPVPLLSLSEQKKYVNELIYKEKLIYEEMQKLYTQSAIAKWDFYQKIGLGEIIKKESL